MTVTKKIWGNKHSILNTDQIEIDLLYLDKDTCCSIHTHDNKINRFVLLMGEVKIKSSLGDYDLTIDEPFDVEPGVMHQFVVNEYSVMIELAYVKEGYIDKDDIKRFIQGGKFVNGEFFSLDQLKIEGRLEL